MQIISTIWSMPAMNSWYPEGVSFARLHEEGIDLIVSKVEIDYKYPLRSRDRFVVQLNVERAGNVRLLFRQEIFRIPDEKLIVTRKGNRCCNQKGKTGFSGKYCRTAGIKIEIKI